MRSARDSWEQIVEKCGIWIAHGCSCAWAIDPLARRVTELRTAHRVVVQESGHVIVCAAPVLPDFQMRLADVFSDLDA